MGTEGNNGVPVLPQRKGASMGFEPREKGRGKRTVSETGNTPWLKEWGGEVKKKLQLVKRKVKYSVRTTKRSNPSGENVGTRPNPARKQHVLQGGHFQGLWVVLGPK